MAAIALCILYMGVAPWPGASAGGVPFTVESGQALSGATVVRVDDEAWHAAVLDAGLPEPPALDGTDAVPADVLLAAFRDWRQTRDPEALGRLARIYVGLDAHEAALQCFAALCAMQPQRGEWHYFLGAEAELLGLDALAITSLEDAARLEPDYSLTFARIGQLALGQGDLERAKQRYEVYKQRRPNESLGYVGLGRVALAQGDGDEAERLLKMAVTKTPNDFKAHRLLARALAVNGKEDEAAAATRRAERLPQYSGWVSFDPRLQDVNALANTQSYLTNRMRTAAAAQQWEAFIPTATEMLERRPNDVATMSTLASVYRELGRLDEAEALITQAIALEPQRPGLYCVQAEVEFARRDFADVHRSLERALAIDARLARAHELKGRALFLEGRPREAIEAMEQAARLDPTASETRLALADMYRRTGRAEDAVRLLEALLAEDGSNALARQLLEAIAQQKQGR